MRLDLRVQNIREDYYEAPSLRHTVAATVI